MAQKWILSMVLVIKVGLIFSLLGVTPMVHNFRYSECLKDNKTKNYQEKSLNGTYQIRSKKVLQYIFRYTGLRISVRMTGSLTGWLGH